MKAGRRCNGTPCYSGLWRGAIVIRSPRENSRVTHVTARIIRALDCSDPSPPPLRLSLPSLISSHSPAKERRNKGGPSTPSPPPCLIGWRSGRASLSASHFHLCIFRDAPYGPTLGEAHRLFIAHPDMPRLVAFTVNHVYKIRLKYVETCYCTFY